MAVNQGYSYREQVGPEAAGRTVVEWLAARHAHSDAAVWAARVDSGEVELDGARAQAAELLRAGQWLVWHRPPWEEPEVPLSFAVVHEDRDLLVVDKPSGLPTAPAGGFLTHTLQALVQARDPRWTPLHRLGRATSGLVAFAGTERARAALHADLRAHAVEKRYLALAEGRLEGQVIRAPIGRLPHPRLGLLFAAAVDGRGAETHVEEVEPRGADTRAVVRIVTGRPHQIRIHLAWAGHPLVGDPLYAAGGVPRPGLGALPGDGGYHLHAHRLTLRHPATGARLVLEAPPPPALR